MIRRTKFILVCGLMLMLSGIASADLIGHWPFDEGSGDTTADMSASGTTGVIANTATGGPAGGSVWVDDAVRGSVLGFGGGSDSGYVRAGDIPTMTLENDFTWAFWANQSPENTQPNNIIVGNRYNADGVDFAPRQFIKFTPTKFEWHMNGNGNDNTDYPDLSETAGTWQHHAVVKDGADVKYYLNGVETATNVLTQALDGPQPLFFGGDLTGADGENWQGLLDEVRIYDHALSASEVGALVPEPSTATLLLVGLLPLLRRRR